MSSEAGDFHEENNAVLISYRTEYYHQISVIDRLVSKSRYLLIFLLGLASLAIAILGGLARPLDWWDGAALLGFVASLFPWIKSVACLWDAFHRETCVDIPTVPNFEQGAESELQFVKSLRHYYSESADRIREANRARIKSINIGINWLAGGTACIAFMALVTFGRLISVAPGS